MAKVKDNNTNVEEVKDNILMRFTDEEVAGILDEYDSTHTVTNPKFNSIFEVADTVGMAKSVMLSAMRKYHYEYGTNRFYKAVNKPNTILEYAIRDKDDDSMILFKLEKKDEERVKEEIIECLPCDACVDVEDFVIRDSIKKIMF